MNQGSLKYCMQFNLFIRLIMVTEPLTLSVERQVYFHFLWSMSWPVTASTSSTWRTCHYASTKSSVIRLLARLGRPTLSWIKSNYTLKIPCRLALTLHVEAMGARWSFFQLSPQCHQTKNCQLNVTKWLQLILPGAEQYNSQIMPESLPQNYKIQLNVCCLKTLSFEVTC